MAYPTTYKYTKEHEWLDVNGSIGTIGITDYAQSTLGDIVFVEMPKIGDTVTGGATFGSVESVKAVSDLYSPISGTVTAINEDAHKAWIIKVELSDPAQVSSLLDAAAYEAFIAEEAGH